MFPELFRLGPFSLRTMSVFLVCAFLATSFVFWRRGKEEHYREDQLFDSFLLALVVGLLAARVGFVALNIEQLGFSPLAWIDIFSHPGFSAWAGLVGGGLYLKRYARANKWDAYEILDFAATSISLGAVFVWIGQFFEGSGVGNATSLLIGVRFPNLLEPHHPLQLYSAAFYLLLFWYLSWVEYHYRTFAWYRIGKRTAQTGFLISTFIIGASLFSLLTSWLQPVGQLLYGISMQRLLSGVSLLLGILMLYVRSGRALPFTREQQKRKQLQQRITS